MIEFETLPKGWTIAKIDDVIIRMTNGANAVQYKEKVGLPISRIETISNETIDLERVKYIKETDADFIDKYKLRNGDILFSHINSDSHLGKTALFKIENKVTLIHGINLLLLRPSPEILPEIINYQIKYLRAQGKFSSIAQKAVNQSSINQAKLKAFEILIPPLNEQKRILAKLEQLLTDLDKGIEYLETTKQQLKVYRQAVLKWAFEGKLTNMIELSEVTSKIGSGATPKGGEANYKRTGIPLIRSMNIHFNQIEYNGLAFIDETQAKELDNVIVKVNDVLLNITGASIGRINIAPKNLEGARVNQHVSIIRLKEGFSSKFVKYFIQSPTMQTWITKENYGVTRQALTKGMIEQILIPNIDIQEQNQIIQEIESRLSVCDKIEETIESSLQQAEALRLSIIKKAFEGKLVPQDPNDEPAEKLLEKIRALRQAQGKQGNGKPEKKEKVKASKKKVLVNG